MEKYSTGICDILLESKVKHLRVIGENILKHLGPDKIERTFETESLNKKLAFFADRKCLNRFPGKFFISEDRSSETLNGMMVAKASVVKKSLKHLCME